MLNKNEIKYICNKTNRAFYTKNLFMGEGVSPKVLGCDVVPGHSGSGCSNTCRECHDDKGHLPGHPGHPVPRRPVPGFSQPRQVRKFKYILTNSNKNISIICCKYVIIMFSQEQHLSVHQETSGAVHGVDMGAR